MGRECLEMDLTSRQRSFSPVAGTDRHGQGINSRTPPNCARCRNHDIIVPLKGHKRYCKFNECTCEKCQLTADRQKVMARQTAIRRAEEQDRQRVKNGLPVPGRSSPRGGGGSPPPNSGSMSIPIDCSEPDNSCSSKPDTPSTSKAKLAAISRRNSTSASVDHGKDMWDNILLLLNWCGLPVNTTPLLHVILSKITSDANEVYRFIREASEELKQTCPIKDDVRRQPTPLDHLSPWAPLYYPPTVPHAIPQPPSLYKQSTHHYHPGLALPSLRYHPYQVLPPTYKTSLLRTFDPLGYSLHEATRPSVVVPTEYYYRTDDRLDGKPASPSSVHSDKSSYSGSVEI